MMQEAKFETSVSLDDCIRFAEISGDWNPLHTDPSYAATSVYGRQVLHGAFSAGLISRMAGMHLPGKDCLLHGIKLRFVSPILPPATLLVRGQLVGGSEQSGRVAVTISDAHTGALCVDASYEFTFHRVSAATKLDATVGRTGRTGESVVLVTGASGGLGGAMLRRLGNRGVALARNKDSDRLDMAGALGESSPYKGRIAAIVHCAWPAPDNRQFIDLEDPVRAIGRHVTGPLQDIQTLSALLARDGEPNAPLVLVGSTFAKAGRHNFRMPLYSIAKSTIPTVVDILALELASKGKRCFGVVFDVIDGGMNKGISDSSRVANADRSPWGELASPDEAAGQIEWLLENQSRLLSGATMTLAAGAIP